GKHSWPSRTGGNPGVQEGVWFFAMFLGYMASHPRALQTDNPVTIAPAVTPLVPLSGKTRFTCPLSGGCTWSLNSNGTCDGTIDVNGVYTAPASLANGATWCYNNIYATDPSNSSHFATVYMALTSTA